MPAVLWTLARTRSAAMSDSNGSTIHEPLHVRSTLRLRCMQHFQISSSGPALICLALHISQLKAFGHVPGDDIHAFPRAAIVVQRWSPSGASFIGTREGLNKCLLLNVRRQHCPKFKAELPCVSQQEVPCSHQCVAGRVQ